MGSLSLTPNNYLEIGLVSISSTLIDFKSSRVILSPEASQNRSIRTTCIRTVRLLQADRRFPIPVLKTAATKTDTDTEQTRIDVTNVLIASVTYLSSILVYLIIFFCME